MKALTIRQPWASLIAVGAKTIETRSWHTKYRGPVLIHAAAAFPRFERELCERQPFASGLSDVRRNAKPASFELFPVSQALPLGQVVAVAELVACKPAEMFADVFRHRSRGCMPFAEFGIDTDRNQYVGVSIPYHEPEFGDYRRGRFGWILQRVQRLPNPVPAKGALSLWTPDDDVLQRVLAQVEASA